MQSGEGAPGRLPDLGPAPPMTPSASDTGAVADTVRRRVEELLGPEALHVASETPEGEAPDLPVAAAPADGDEAAALLRVAGEQGWRVLPTGARVAGPRAVEGAPSPHLHLSSRRMTGILEYEPADLTIRAGAGVTLEALDRILAPEGQWLPLDPPGGVGVSLGGVVAEGIAGPLSAAFGRPRDQLLGLTLADGGGRVLELGGRVVKNVAGFDLVRLSCGSRGTLGFISEISFRLYPRPAADRTLLWTPGSSGDGVQLARTLAGLSFVPASLELLVGIDLEREGLAPVPDAVVLLRLVGSETGVHRVERAARELAGSPDRLLDGEDSRLAAIERSTREGRVRPLHRHHALPARIGRLLEELEPDGRPVAVHVLSGTARCLGWTPLRANHRSPSEGRVGGGGNAGGEEARGAALLSRLRRVFDPEGILPGAWREGWA